MAQIRASVPVGAHRRGCRQHLRELPTPWPSGDGARGAGLDPALVLRTLGMLPMLRAPGTQRVGEAPYGEYRCEIKAAPHSLAGLLAALLCHRPVVSLGHNFGHMLTSASRQPQALPVESARTSPSTTNCSLFNALGSVRSPACQNRTS